MIGLPRNERMPVIKEERRPKSNRKLLIFLTLFFIIVLTILFFNSSLSKIDHIEVKGTRFVSEDQIGQAIGIAVGDQFFSTRALEIEKRVTKIPTVQSVEVEKNFPGAIIVHIREFPEVAYIMNAEGELDLLLANGHSVAFEGIVQLVNRPILSGWEEAESAELVRDIGRMLSTIPDELLSDVSEIRPDVSQSYPDKIKLYTRSHFEITTTISYLPTKIENMSAIINVNEPGKITMLEADYYTPYDFEDDSNNEQ